MKSTKMYRIEVTHQPDPFRRVDGSCTETNVTVNNFMARSPSQSIQGKQLNSTNRQHHQMLQRLNTRSIIGSDFRHQIIKPNIKFQIKRNQTNLSSKTSNRPQSLKRFIYPIILFSLLTSFTINLKSIKLENDQKFHKLNGQISILENILLKLKKRGYEFKDENEKKEFIKSIEKDLELVGLKEKSSIPLEGFKVSRNVSWKEVFFGRSDLGKIDTEKSENDMILGLMKEVEETK
ncbi:hypothetical protein DFH28DRAFT_433459 [Melampsora americana]|nr:hypothetical protein DFH28DRAFT_433459 [Melampsora americana]